MLVARSNVASCRVVQDEDTLPALELAMSEWTAALASAMQAESEKQPVGSGPLAEIEFWRKRNAVLSGLYEQLNLPAVRKMVRGTHASVSASCLVCS